MAKPLTTGMPPNLACYGGYTIELTALDPTSGALVSTVKVSKLVIEIVTGDTTQPSDLAVGGFLLVPGPDA